MIAFRKSMFAALPAMLLVSGCGHFPSFCKETQDLADGIRGTSQLNQYVFICIKGRNFVSKREEFLFLAFILVTYIYY